ncbi:MAG: response regulator [Saprospiraceae bacterium]
MATKILVVEDEPQFERLILQRFRKKIKEGAYEFFFAHNGLEALEVLKAQEGIEVVLSDINMPKMDGITLTAEIRARFPLIRVVIVSAYGDMENIRAAMNQGAFDFITKPINFEDLDLTIEKTIKEVEVLWQAKKSQALAIKNEQLQALDLQKSQFFTNIAHEFRTPLTVILGMAEQIKAAPDRWLDQGIAMINRNGNNLLHLVNEMLDLRKLEAGKLPLKMIQGEVISYLHYIVDSFQLIAEKRGISIHFLASEEAIFMDYDPEKMLSILSNLLSNAFKFTPEGGHIYLHLEKLSYPQRREDLATEALSIKIRDTGIGISPDDLPFIFDRFYQVALSEQTLHELANTSSSTGIGLALLKELVKYLGGTVDVESKLGEGTTFQILLPIHHQQPAAQVQSAIKEKVKQMAAFSLSNEPVEQISVASPKLPQLLIVEDHPDILQYMRALLEADYQLHVAKDGEEGIAMAIEQVPDIIISDVMMPRKDGFELCETLKLDERTSHIPIILLTAKNDATSRLAGLKRGADAYLGKPFQKEELFIRLEQLLTLRRNLQKRYSSFSPLTDTTESDNPLFSNIEDSFLIRLHEVLEANIEEEFFGIPELCHALFMSRAQLHRKIKALTGLSTSHYVRAIRLNKAKKLLETSNLNISEVAFSVGFKDPKYFSRTYSEVFGHAPTDTPKRP